MLTKTEIEAKFKECFPHCRFSVEDFDESTNVTIDTNFYSVKADHIVRLARALGVSEDSVEVEVSWDMGHTSTSCLAFSVRFPEQSA